MLALVAGKQVAVENTAELAGVYVYLASQESSYVTAEVHGVTGGEHLG
jgi:NAD(P)-dependent dehydrogenase (short-subunit alcohol dehydrogenase family)